MTEVIDLTSWPPVAVLGLGTMGAAVARRLLAAGMPVTVWDRTRARTEPLVAAGAAQAHTPLGAVNDVAVAITMLSDRDAVWEVAAGEHGLLDGLPSGAIWLQMSTIGVAATDELVDAVAGRRPDIRFVDAPVSGSRLAAESGKLTVLASGEYEALERLEPVFDAVATRVLSLGDAGGGSRLKVVVNAWLAVLMEGIAEVACLADRVEVRHDTLLELIEGGPLEAPWAIDKLRKADRGELEPEFSLRLALKDVDLALLAGGPGLPLLTAVHDQWSRVEGDLGDFDVSAAVVAHRWV